MQDRLARIRAAAASHEAGSVDFLRGLIRAGRSGEDAVQRCFAAAVRALGATVETISYDPAEVPMVAEFAGAAAINRGRRENVVARLPGSGKGRSLILFAHPDGEPVAGTEAWRHDPFQGIVCKGRVHGWGVADDLAGLAAMVEGLRVLLSSGLRPAGDIILASTPSKRHARGVSALLHGGLTADAAVYLHPAESGEGMREVKAFAAGQLEFRVVVTGRPPMTGEPHQTGFAHLGVNPLAKMLVIAAALEALDTRRAKRVHHPALDARVGRSTNLMLSYIDAGTAQALSRMADDCTLGAALSFPPGESLEGLRVEVETSVAEACASDEWLAHHPARIIWDAGVTGAEVSPDHPLYTCVAQAVLNVTGQSPTINVMHTSSDIRNPMVQKGIPTVGLGPLCGDLTQTGGADEWVDCADYLRSVTVVGEVMALWCEAV